MFERIKCYRSLKEADKIIEWTKEFGEQTGDDEMVRLANDALNKNAYIRKRIIFNRKLAARYNKGLREELFSKQEGFSSLIFRVKNISLYENKLHYINGGMYYEY